MKATASVPDTPISTACASMGASCWMASSGLAELLAMLPVPTSVAPYFWSKGFKSASSSSPVLLV
ncbi:hypothetical protein D3C72_2071140 [compost metagenome]